MGVDLQDKVKKESLLLRKAIESSIETSIGEYHFATGKVCPAVALVRSLSQPYPPPGTKVFGLEVVILYPQITYIQNLGALIGELEWQIFFKQHDHIKSIADIVAPAIAKICEIGQIWSSVSVAPNPAKQQPAMLVFSIKKFEGL